MQNIFEFKELEVADLIVDASYRGGSAGNAGDDALHPLLGCGTQGGIRYTGSSKKLSCQLVIIYSSLADPDWPDYLDDQTGQFSYFGDNKIPGRELHDTRKKGNIILRDSFAACHSGKREDVPPFFVFTKGIKGRDVIFKGIAVPGALGLPPTEDLVAIWKSKGGQRFQNYRAIFTILDVPVVSRAWIIDVRAGNRLSENCPEAWRQWVDLGKYSPLRAQKTRSYRSKKEQEPRNITEKAIVKRLNEYFGESSYDFEKFAAELVKLMDSNIASCDLTRPWMDGGRDAVGKYRIGAEDNCIEVEFALEAKCYSPKNAVGVKETSRLISRLRYRQFGIFVTTSYVHMQAYKEIIEDRHPVIVICARDIVDILKRAGYYNIKDLDNWLEANFPVKD